MSKISIEEAISREILLAGYTVSRQTGFRPANLRRAIRNIRLTKLIYSALFSGYVALFSALSKLAGQFFSPFVSSLFIFSMSGLGISGMLVPLSYAVYGLNNARDFLMTTPLDIEQIHRLVGRAIFKTIDYILYGIVGTSLVLGLAFSKLYIAYSAALGASLGFLFQLISLEVSYRRTKASSMVARGISSLAMFVFLIPIMISGALYKITLEELKPFFFVPPICAAFGNSVYGSIASVAWIAAFAYGIYRLLPDASWKLISGPPSAFFREVSKKVSEGWKIVRSQTLAILRADFQAAGRSILASLIVGPSIVFIVVLFNSISSKATASLAFALGIEMAYLSILLPYAFYALEMRGASVLRMMPISKVKIALPKLLLLFITYYIYEGGLAAVMLIKGLSVSALLPFLAGFLAPASSVPLTGIIFEEILKSGGSISFLLSAIFFVISIAVVAIPYAIYFIFYIFLKYSLMASLGYMNLAGLLEFSTFVFILSRYD